MEKCADLAGRVAGGCQVRRVLPEPWSEWDQASPMSGGHWEEWTWGTVAVLGLSF